MGVPPIATVFRNAGIETLADLTLPVPRRRPWRANIRASGCLAWRAGCGR
jgi:hypothetical protein